MKPLLRPLALFAALGLSLNLLPFAAPVQASETLSFGVAAEPYPPFLVKSPSGEFTGFEPDLIRALCQQMQATCEIREVAWDGIIPALLAKKFDVIFNSMGISPERQKVIAFSRPYYEATGIFVAAKDSQPDLSPQGLAGKSIGVQGSTTNAAFIRTAYGSTSDVRLYNTQDDCNADLVAGRIDVMFLDKLGDAVFLNSPEGAMFEEKGTGSVKMDPLLYGLGVGAGLRKEDTALKTRIDKALDQLHASGKYTQISRQYFDSDLWPK
ncbi:polar amino acid transport system substrate-binding protein [Pseudomonas nitritireducens]|uniref:Polar amino acid transport system substrate-binding protein n=1 Tax=Pseudomonas nitroreducens TaxID=46680 RepID=A0A7W7KLB3_PSENT|nr:transporter substrate-binding domain-containing protein [Pseudomonas nitritireducens]MBB4864881.1 polar amino acid transport system substrate-binding protein [Pseudomonas nitritireducens]